MSDIAKAKNCLLGKPLKINYNILQEDDMFLYEVLVQEYPDYIPQVHEYIFLKYCTYIVLTKFYNIDENILHISIQEKEIYDKFLQRGKK